MKITRRSLLAATLAPLQTLASQKTGMARWMPGGINGTTTARIGCLGTSTDIRGVPCIPLPKVSVMYVLPTNLAALSAGAFFNEADDVTADDAGVLMIQTPGRWRATLSADWPGHTMGRGLRKITIWMARQGTALPQHRPGHLTVLQGANPYVRIGAVDIPGSQDTPSADAWSTCNAPDMYLIAGDAVFFTVASEQPGDWIQCCTPGGRGQLRGSTMTWGQLELIAKPT